MGPWSKAQRRNYEATMAKKRAVKQRANQVVHIPAAAIQAMAGKSGYAVKSEAPGSTVQLDVKVGSQMAVTVGGMTLLLRAVE